MTLPASAPPRARLHAVLVAVVLAVLGFFAYRNGLDAPFVHDDERSIRDNPRIRALWPSDDTRYPVQTSEAGRPVVRFTLALNHALGELELGGAPARALGIGRGGTNVRGYHVFNLSVHVLSAWLVFVLVRRTSRLAGAAARLREAAPSVAPCAAALWLVHPLGTDAVTYVIQRTELLMGLFTLLTLLTASLALDGRRAGAWSLLSVLCCALGMGCKESMAAAPILVVLYDRAFAFASFRAALRARWRLYAGLAATWVLLAALIASGPRSETVGLGLGVEWWRYAATQLGVILGYLRLALWPDELCLDHGRQLASTAAEIVPGAIVVGALALATLWALLRRPALGFLGAWFFLILAPSSSVVPIVTEVAAERRMYLPLIALVVLVVLGLHELARGIARRTGAASARALVLARAGVAAATVVLVPVLTAVTVQRNADFESDLTIWEDTVAKRPDSFVARNNLARAYTSRRRYDDALAQLSAATALPGCPVNVFVNLASAFVNTGRLEEAESLLRHVLGEQPSYAPARCSLALVLSRKKWWGAAIAEYRACLEAEESAEARYGLGRALLELGRVPEAAEQLERALALDPTHAAASASLERARKSGRVPSAGG